MKINFKFEQDFTTYGPIYDTGRWFVRYRLVGTGSDTIHLSNTMEFIRGWLAEEFGDESVPGFVEHVPRVDPYVGSDSRGNREVGLWLIVTTDHDMTGWRALPVEIEAVQRTVSRGKEWLNGMLSLTETAKNGPRASE
ncbi:MULTISPECIES: hypothetical protein [unclassified Rhodococcus (in: high G+C Gram-positive bacteria)]|uniref:hypothetical protein n=1 Tax=unclassified Rhodococcus (in: high G+C Gram-positive bacteria) TaxID=192944 RepID=UPI00096AC976|nr:MULTISPECIES: hypothetical protein [unclassified Rhodococcus (in: high G+C Gram-positive bacteria)]